VGPLMDGPEQVRGAAEILQRQAEENLLRRLPGTKPACDGVIVGRAVPDGMIEDRRVGGEPGHAELFHIALQGAAVQQVAGDVVEPQALTQVMQRLRCLHVVTSMALSDDATRRYPCAGFQCPSGSAKAVYAKPNRGVRSISPSPATRRPALSF